MQTSHATQYHRNHRVSSRRSSLPAFNRHLNNNNNIKNANLNKLYEQLQFSEGVGPLPNRRVSFTSSTQIPSHHLLLAISGGSKSSLPHTSIQQLSAIPEDHELTEYETEPIPEEEEEEEDGIEEQHIVICDPAPNGGYGWVIVLASFLSNVIVDGIAYTFGMFLQKFVDHYHTSKGNAALVGSLLSGCYLSAGPVVSALVNRFGCRAVSISGSIIAFMAFLLSTIAPNIGILMLTYGIMGGIGFGLIYLPAIVSVGYYFTTKRAFATGIAVCGSGVGAFLFAPFCTYLLSIYDWRNTLVILAALALNCSVFGSLMRPLSVRAEAVITEDSNTKSSSRKPLLQRIAEEKRRRLLSHSNSQFLLLLQSGIESRDVNNEIRSRLLMNTEPGVHSTLYLDEILTQATQPLSSIAERLLNSESSTPVSSQPGSPTNEDKDITDAEMQLQDSAISLSGELTFPSTTTIAQTPPPEAPVNRLGGSVQLSGPPRARRSSTLRTVSESSNAPPPLQVILSSDTPTHSRRSSLRNSQTVYVRPMYKKDIFYSGSTLQLPPNSSIQQIAESQGIVTAGNIANMGNSVVSIPARDIINKVQQQLTLKDRKNSIYNKNDNCCSQLISSLNKKDQKQDLLDADYKTDQSKCFRFEIPSSMKTILKEMLDFSLIRQSGAFSLLAVANVFGMMGFYVPFVYLMEFALNHVKEGDKLITTERSALLISIIGITNTFGRLLFGFLSDKINNAGSIGGIRITALTINNICCFLCGLSVIAMPFCQTYYTVLFDCVLFGLFGSAYICLTSIILVDLLGLDKLTNAFGLLSLFRGASSMVGPPIAGILYDSTQSYYIIFATSGSFLIISSLISFLIPNEQIDEKSDRDNECNV